MKKERKKEEIKRKRGGRKKKNGEVTKLERKTKRRMNMEEKSEMNKKYKK